MDKEEKIMWLIKHRQMTPDEAIEAIETFPNWIEKIITETKVEILKTKNQKNNANKTHNN